jgi:hypothetical protein
VVRHIEELKRIRYILTDRAHKNLPAVIRKLLLTVDCRCRQLLPLDLVLNCVLRNDLGSFRQRKKVLIVPAFMVDHIEESINQLQNRLLSTQ